MSGLTRANIFTILLSVLFFYVAVTYNACSQVEFEKLASVADDEDSTGLGDRGGSITINGGDQYTQNKQVFLNLDSGELPEMRISNKADCSDGVWEPFSENKAWDLSNENDVVAVFVTYRAGIDEVSKCHSDKILHDNQPPAVVYGEAQDKWFNSRNKNIKFIASDLLSGLNGVWCGKSPDFQLSDCVDMANYTALLEGTHALVVKARDRAGNETQPEAFRWGVDVTPPVILINSAPSAMTNESMATFKFVATDSVSGISKIECKIGNGPWEVCTSPYVKSGLVSKAYKAQFRAYDLAMNVSETAVHKWTVDVTAPTVRITRHPDPLTKSTDATFEFEGDDQGTPISDFECKLDAGAWASCTSPKAYSGLADGKHRFQVRGMDASGNVSTPARYNWVIDSTKPTIAFVPPLVKLSSKTKMRFQFNASDNGGSGIKEIQCKLDSNSYMNCGTSEEFTNLSNGTHVVYARALDKAGNYSNIIRHSWVVDSEKPKITITKGPDPYTADTTASLEFVATDNGLVKEIQCSIDGSAYMPCTSPKIYSGLDAGGHSFSVRAVDNVGLMSDPATHSWVIDDTGPTIAFVVYPKNVIKIDTKPIINFEVDDGDSGVASYSCTFDGNPIACTMGQNIVLPLKELGNHTFVVYAEDNVGNTSTGSKSWKVEPPEFELKTKDLAVNDDSKAVDILFVIDNSGSMRPEHANTAQRMAGFLDKVASVDWQIALTTTNTYNDTVGTSGRFIPLTGVSPAQYILKSTSAIPNKQKVVGDTIQIGANSVLTSGAEQGIYATYRAVSRYVDSAGAINQYHGEFFRDGADLAVLLISDEREAVYGGRWDALLNLHNDLNAKNKPSELIQLVKDTWGVDKSFTFHSIITKPGDAACAAFQYHTAGVTYEELSNLTGGVVGSVCEPDYAAQLDEIGQRVIDQIKTIDLDCEPFDHDGNGSLDIVINHTDPNGVMSVYSGNYKVMGMKLMFDDILPVGDFSLTYYCSK